MAESSIAAWMGTGGGARPGIAESELQREFPFLRFARDVPGRDLSVDAWRASSLDFWAFDRRYDDRRGTRFRFVLRGPRARLERELLAILTRLQRLFGRRNDRSADPRFDALLERHAAMHDVRLPLVRADHDHALDVWQWVLRLDADASLELQAAALLHDVERLDTEAERRVEHRHGDYVAFKAAHAARGAARAAALVRRCGFPLAAARRVGELVRAHERPSGDPEVRVLNDADALSFFSLNAAGFAAYFPHAHLLRKVGVTLSRMSEEAKRRLSSIRLPAAVDAVFASIQSPGGVRGTPSSIGSPARSRVAVRRSPAGARS